MTTFKANKEATVLNVTMAVINIANGKSQLASDLKIQQADVDQLRFVASVLFDEFGNDTIKVIQAAIGKALSYSVTLKLRKLRSMC